MLQNPEEWKSNFCQRRWYEAPPELKFAGQFSELPTFCRYVPVD